MDSEVKALNKDILAALRSAFGTKTDIATYGLAEPITMRGEDETTLPAIVLPKGECVSVFYEADRHEVMLYHKLNRIDYTEQAGYGERRTYDRKADMSVIVYGKRELSQYDMENVLCQAISLNHDRVVGGSEFNAVQIMATEYVGQAYFLGTDYFVFRTNYTITSTCNDGCTNN